MRLTELEPKWLMHEGMRVGFIFRSPANRDWWQSCMLVPMTRAMQFLLFKSALNSYDDAYEVQGCKEGCLWRSMPDGENASFDTISITPSIDGSPGGLWHGHITNGEIVG